MTAFSRFAIPKHPRIPYTIYIMKTVLFIPGFQEDLTSRDYAKTIHVIERAGYDVKFVPINWFRTTIEQWVDELNAVYDQYEPADVILAGFSYGAMTAFMAATKRSPAAVWCFSMSPFFREDLTQLGYFTSWLKAIGRHRQESFMKLEFARLVKLISSDMLFFYGETELKHWTDITYRHSVVAKIPRAQEIFIPHAKHDVTGDPYIEAIASTIA